MNLKVNKILRSLEIENTLDVPDKYLNQNPINFDISSRLNFAEHLNPELIADKVIAFDLDDTILCSSWTLRKTWTNLGKETEKAFNLIAFNKSFRALLSNIKAKHFLYSWYSRDEYKFLQNPYVEVQLRPGILELLTYLKFSGATLVLITASKQKRLDYIWQRLPFLKKLFMNSEGRVFSVSAENLVEAALTLIQKSDSQILAETKLENSIAQNCLDILRKSKPSLAAKTPLLVECILDIADYDLLIDDSLETYSLFKKNKLEQKILYIDKNHQDYNGSLQLAISIKKLLNNSNINMPVSLKGDDLVADKLYRFEDPLYYPLLHKKLEYNI